jgi:hypothetical protein
LTRPGIGGDCCRREQTSLLSGNWSFFCLMRMDRSPFARAAVERNLTAVICNRNIGVDTESVNE